MTIACRTHTLYVKVMSQWSETLKSHAIWESLRTQGPVLDEALQLKEMSVSDIEAITRIKAVLEMVGKHVAGLDPHLVSFVHLGAVANSLNEATSQVRQFVANRNSGHLTNANAQAEGLIQNLAAMTAASTDSMVWAKEAAEAYRRGLETLLEEAKESAASATDEVTALKVRVGELTSEVTSEKQRLTLLTSEFQSQFSGAQEARRQESAALQKEHEGALSALERDYTEKLEAETKQFDAVIDRAAKDQQAALAALKSEFVSGAEAMTGEMKAHLAEVEKLVGVIGDLGVTSGYKVAAERAEKAATAWQRGTVAALLGLVLVAGVTLFQIVKGEFSWLGLSGRVFISVAFGVLAAYCGAQAEKYQRGEVRNRRLALELAALGPFLAPLPKEKQDEFRLSVGARTFGREEAAHGLEVKSPTTALEVLNSKEVGDIVIALLRKALK